MKISYMFKSGKAKCNGIKMTIDEAQKLADLLDMENDSTTQSEKIVIANVFHDELKILINHQKTLLENETN